MFFVYECVLHMHSMRSMEHANEWWIKFNKKKQRKSPHFLGSFSSNVSQQVVRSTAVSHIILIILCHGIWNWDETRSCMHSHERHKTACSTVLVWIGIKQYSVEREIHCIQFECHSRKLGTQRCHKESFTTCDDAPQQRDKKMYWKWQQRKLSERNEFQFGSMHRRLRPSWEFCCIVSCKTISYAICDAETDTMCAHRAQSNAYTFTL